MAVFAVTLLGIAGFLFFADRGTDRALAIPPPSPPPIPEPGPARSWEADVAVSTFSSWHTRHGNTFTTIPIVAVSGSGPDLVMNLYHNAASVSAAFDIGAGSGIRLGPGWTTSYSSQIVLDNPSTPTTGTVVADDGTQLVFRWEFNKWNAPIGNHDLLTAGGDSRVGPDWTLLHKNQSRTVYKTEGGVTRLQKAIDAVGHESVVTYETVGQVTRILSVFGAGGRHLDFVYDPYDPSGQLTTITDPRDEGGEPAVGEIDDRHWTFTYDSNNRIETLSGPWPLTNRIEMTYDTAGRLGTVSDWAADGEVANIYAYTYDAVGHLTHVDDPTPVPGQPQLFQTLSLTANGPTYIKATHTDRRGNAWEYEYSSMTASSDGNLAGSRTPSGITVGSVMTTSVTSYGKEPALALGTTTMTPVGT